MFEKLQLTLREQLNLLKQFYILTIYIDKINYLDPHLWQGLNNNFEQIIVECNMGNRFMLTINTIYTLKLWYAWRKLDKPLKPK